MLWVLHINTNPISSQTGWMTNTDPVPSFVHRAAFIPSFLGWNQYCSCLSEGDTAGGVWPGSHKYRQKYLRLFYPQSWWASCLFGLQKVTDAIKSNIQNYWKLQILLNHSCMKSVKHEPFPSMVQHRTAGLEQQQTVQMSWLSATSVQEEDQSNIWNGNF